MFDSKLKKFQITLSQRFLSFLPKLDRFPGKSQSRKGVLSGRFVFKDPNGQDILKSKAETKKSLDTG